MGHKHSPSLDYLPVTQTQRLFRRLEQGVEAEEAEAVEEEAEAEAEQRLGAV